MSTAGIGERPPAVPRVTPAGWRRRPPALADVERPELVWLAVAVVLALVIRLAYVYLTRGHTLAGDEPQYDEIGRLATQGHWLWSSAPYGNPHPSAWKTPVYPLWMGFWYTLLGAHYDRLLAIQAVLSVALVPLTWLLARRLAGPRAALLAAFVVAVYPNTWQFAVRLFPDGLATILTLGILLLVIGVQPTRRRAVAAGALLGVLLLTRSSSVLLLAGVAVAWWIAAGWRRGTGYVVIVAAVAALVVAPWTIRNAVVLGGFVPFSVQDAAISGTFNATAAQDPVSPYAWRSIPPRDRVLLHTPRSELSLYHALRARGVAYIRAHPESVPASFFWNGLSRLWDVRRPAHVLAEVPFEGRTRGVALAGLLVYWPLLVLALAGLWRNRRRRDVVLPTLAIALAASVVFTVASGSRYRATLEPLIVVMACTAVVPMLDLRRPAL